MAKHSPRAKERASAHPLRKPISSNNNLGPKPNDGIPPSPILLFGLIRSGEKNNPQTRSKPPSSKSIFQPPRLKKRPNGTYLHGAKSPNPNHSTSPTEKKKSWMTAERRFRAILVIFGFNRRGFPHPFEGVRARRERGHPIHCSKAWWLVKTWIWWLISPTIWAHLKLREGFYINQDP